VNAGVKGPQRTMGSTDARSAAQHEARLAAVLAAELDGAARRGLDATVPPSHS